MRASGGRESRSPGQCLCESLASALGCVDEISTDDVFARSWREAATRPRGGGTGPTNGKGRLAAHVAAPIGAIGSARRSRGGQAVAAGQLRNLSQRERHSLAQPRPSADESGGQVDRRPPGSLPAREPPPILALPTDARTVDRVDPGRERLAAPDADPPPVAPAPGSPLALGATVGTDRQPASRSDRLAAAQTGNRLLSLRRHDTGRVTARRQGANPLIAPPHRT